MIRSKTHVWRIGEILIQSGWLGWDALDNALVVQKENRRFVGEILAESGVVSERLIYWALAEQFGMIFIELSKVKPHAEAIQSIPKEIAFRHRVLPLVKKDSVLLVAIADPMDLWPQIELTKLAGIHSVRMVLCAPEELEEAILEYYGPERVRI